MSQPVLVSDVSMGAPAPRLLDQVRQAAMKRYGRPEAGERYADVCRRYVLFHGTRHPRELGVAAAASRALQGGRVAESGV